MGDPLEAEEERSSFVEGCMECCMYQCGMSGCENSGTKQNGRWNKPMAELKGNIGSSLLRLREPR